MPGSDGPIENLGSTSSHLIHPCFRGTCLRNVLHSLSWSREEKRQVRGRDTEFGGGRLLRSELLLYGRPFDPSHNHLVKDLPPLPLPLPFPRWLNLRERGV